MSILSMSILLAEELNDIAPPVDYSLIPPWAIFAGVLLALALAGFIIWLLVNRRKAPGPVQTPRDRAFQILRRYVTEQYQLPLTRQTSVEFLAALANSSAFSEDDKSLLGDFLNRCDLIKFARYDATSEDSRLLLDEATRFVQGGKLEPA